MVKYYLNQNYDGMYDIPMPGTPPIRRASRLARLSASSAAWTCSIENAGKAPLRHCRTQPKVFRIKWPMTRGLVTKSA